MPTIQQQALQIAKSLAASEAARKRIEKANAAFAKASPSEKRVMIADALSVESAEEYADASTYTRTFVDALAFWRRHGKDANTCLRAIYENVIANGGEFVPPPAYKLPKGK